MVFQARFGRTYMIEGTKLSGLNSILSLARDRGYNGSKTVLSARLQAGERTWAKLCEPVDTHRSESGRAAISVRTAKRSKSRDEAVAAAAAVDARRRALAARESAQTASPDD